MFLSALHLWPRALLLQYEFVPCHIDRKPPANASSGCLIKHGPHFGLSLLSSTQPQRAKKTPLDPFHESIWPLKPTSTTSRKCWAWQKDTWQNDSCGFNLQYLLSKMPHEATRTINLSKSYLVYVQYFLRATEMGLCRLEIKFVYCWFMLALFEGTKRL